VNNSGQTVHSIHLSGSIDIFGFDGDGVGAASASGVPLLHLANDSGPGHSGYSGTDSTSASFNLSGPLNSFSNISQDGTSGDVNFGTGLAADGSAFFSLEKPLTSASFTVTNTVPEPGSLAIFAAGLAGLAGLAGVGSMRRRRKQT
jgi:MYXO-CTERM domain-containing protein